MNIRRARIVTVVSMALAVSGIALAPPQWIGLSVAALCGVLLGTFFIDAAKRRRNDARVLAPLPVLLGWAIWSTMNKRSGHVAEIPFGAVFQFVGIAYLVGFGMISVYLTKAARAKE